MKKTIRKILPKKLWKKLALLRFERKYFSYYWYDFKRYTKHSNSFFQKNTEEKYLNLISVYTHILEKGMTMPETRIGFGKVKINGLIELCEEYISKNYDTTNPRYINCIAVLKEYVNMHLEKKYQFDESFDKILSNFLLKYDAIQKSQQYSMTKEQYFKDTNSSFDQFALSRHSIRSFEGKIEVELIKKAINLANLAPSACNRQSQKVYIIENKDVLKEIRNIQIGSSGFGDLADKYLVITYSLDFWVGYSDRNAGYFDAGLFTMNLLYALHYYQIGACPLNAYFNPIQDKLFRGKVKIQENENIACIIALGGVPSQFKIALSERVNADSVTTLIQ